MEAAEGMQKKESKSELYYDSESKDLDLRESAQNEVFEMLNQRWALVVLRELSAGRARFNVLSKTTKINANTLRDRLREMEALDIVDRKIISSMPPKVEYCLTRKGRELCCVFEAFYDWAEKYAAIERRPKPRSASKVKHR